MENKQKNKILNGDWDFLIVLDDCRYDYFKKNYRKYNIQGRLEPIMSAEVQTQDWFREVFKGTKFKDTVYISANPHINSYGIGPFEHEPLNAHKIFGEIVDVWKDGWDDEIATVCPKKTTDIAIKHISNRNKKYKRYIIHYLQPHSPFLKLLNEYNPSTLPRGVIMAKIKADNVVGNLLVKLNRKLPLWLAVFLRVKVLGMTPRLPEEVAYKYGVERLRELYEYNLQVVLKEVERLLENIPPNSKIVITSDHGEALGDEKSVTLRGLIKSIGHRQMDVPWVSMNVKR